MCVKIQLTRPIHSSYLNRGRYPAPEHGVQADKSFARIRMNINSYTDRIIAILKKTPVDSHHSIWDTFCNDDGIKNNNLNNSHIALLDTVYMDDIQKLKQEDIINLWKCTEDGCIHDCSYLDDPPEYEGDIISDIKNEVIQLIVCDIQFLN